MTRDPALDAFSRLSNSNSKVRLAAAQTLLQYFWRLRQSENEEEVTKIGQRIIRGLACNKDSARRGYYLTFTGFLKVLPNLPYSTVTSLAEKELKVSSANTKGEEGDLWMGRVLFHGALIRSGLYQNLSQEEKSEVVHGLVDASTKRSYLPSVVAPFLVQLMDGSSNEQFMTLLWPALQPSLAKDWSQQTQTSLFLLLHVYKRFKIKKTELKNLLGTQLLAKSNWPRVAQIVLEGQHPVGSLVAQHLPPDECAEFWNEPVLEVMAKASRSRQATALELLGALLKTSDDTNFVKLLGTSGVALLKKGLLDSELRPVAAEVMEVLLTRVKASPDSVRAKVLEMLTAEDFSFDQTTKCGLVRAVAGTMKDEGFGMAIEMCKKVVMDDHKKNRDKSGALQMIATLALSTSVPVETRQDATIFLLEQAFFSSSPTSILSQAAKQNFNRCQKGAPEGVLRAAVAYVDGQLKKKKQPLKMTSAASAAWKKMAQQVAELSAAGGKVEGVLAQLMVHVGLQLLTEPEQALEALEELHECCKRVLGGKQDRHWVEVVVELLLSLLAHPSAALRATVRKVFSALCPLMTQEALDSLIEACSAQDNPLVSKDEVEQMEAEGSEVEEEEDEEDSEEEEENEESQGEEDEEDEDLEDDPDDVEDSAADRVRAAVRSALGMTGEVSDTESIDVDDISEEEGKRLDEALSQAFAAVRKGRTKKESKVQEQVLHFRLRVLDLLETYISAEHSLRFTLGLVNPLLDLLVRCLRDPLMRPLEGRLRNLLTSFGQLRKFAETEGVTEEDLAACLSALLERGQTSQASFLVVASEAAAVAAFLARAAQSTEGSGVLTEAFEKAMTEFFCKRDCALPATFFEPLLKTSWNGNLKFFSLLTEAAFNTKEEAKFFRRPQAVSFLSELITNQQLLVSHPKEVQILLGSLAERAASALLSAGCKQRFERQLLTMIQKLSPKLDEKLKKPLAKAIEDHIPQIVNSGKETKKIFRLAARALKVSVDEQLNQVVTSNIFENGTAENGKSKVFSANPPGKKDKKKKKKEKKQAKKRAKNQESAAKKAAKKMRLETASEGLQAVSFASVNMRKFDD
ncbi:myb-binding protein 1A-like protein [Neocloeon triangulifer]|uniref:myb-binding protein 1A-like protein n=1 Tax=Neocloeon triangulifer TaxID=2078957 RepID=UPI00286F23AD|nr:myb-binding protein 1A-like protein [Neocloeon triangulifer]